MENLEAFVQNVRYDNPKRPGESGNGYAQKIGVLVLRMTRNDAFAECREMISSYIEAIEKEKKKGRKLPDCAELMGGITHWLDSKVYGA